MKKLISLLLAVITVFSMLQVTAFAETRGPEGPDLGLDFDDVPEGHWAFNAVRWAVKSGVTAGIGNNMFGVNETVTRAQAVTFLWAYYGKPTPKTSTNPFTDVKKKDWFYSAVLWAVENGITSGTSANKFSPTRDCRISEITTMIYAMAGKPKIPAGCSNPYYNLPDLGEEEPYFLDALKWCGMKKLHDTIPTEYFAKTGNFQDVKCTRAVIVTLLYNYNYNYSNSCGRVDLKTSVEAMVQFAEAETKKSAYWNYGTRYGGFGKDDKTGKISPWCAAFVSWCGMMSGLADKNGYTFHSNTLCSWKGKDASDSYAYPVLRTRVCFNMMDQFQRTGHLFLSKNASDYMRVYGDSGDKRVEKEATVFTGSFVPRRGDVVFFRNTGDTSVQHVGIVIDVTPNGDGTVTVSTVEGNTSGNSGNGVYEKYYKMELETGHIQSSNGGFDTITGFGRIR